MREFFALERARIDQLVVACAGMTVAMDRYLEQAFFNDQQGRALILQPAGQFGYFYLRTATFDDESKRRSELKSLVDLMMLLTDLRERGWLVVMRSERAPAMGLHYVGTLFDSPRASTAHVVLNAQGDFSFDPAAIQNANGEVIYKGIRLEGDLYEMVLRQLGGTAYCSQGLVAMAAQWRLARIPTLQVPQSPPPQPALPERPPTARKRSATILPWLVTGAVGLALAAGWALLAQPDTPPAAAESTAPPAAVAPPAAAAPTATSTVTPTATPTDTTTDVTTLYGVDLSRWNITDLDVALASDQVKFVILRATYGTSVDSAFQSGWSRLQQHAVARGAYHFYRVNEAPTTQLGPYLSLYPSNDPLAMPPIVDFEALSFDASSPAPPLEQVQSDLLAALTHLEQVTGQTPLLYTNVDIGNRYLSDARFSRFPLWIADWTSAQAPQLPTAWQQVGYRFWQRSSSYTLPVGGTVPMDMDIFRGPLKDLYRQKNTGGP